MVRDRIPVRGREHGQRVLLAALLWALIAALPGAAFAVEPQPKLLLLPFVVHSAEDPEYVRGGLADMLSARFNRVGAVELIRDDDPDHGTSSLNRALAAGRKIGADYVLFGSFTRFGKGASLDVQCAPTSKDEDQEPLREIFVHSGSIGEIIPDLDELAGKVSRFARGEIIERGGPAAPALGLQNRELEDLANRVAVLEAALEDIQAEPFGDVPFEDEDLEDL
jgi:hypothetical protein